MSFLYLFSMGIRRGSVRILKGTEGACRNLRKTLFNVGFGLRQATLGVTFTMELRPASLAGGGFVIPDDQVHCAGARPPQRRC